MNKAKKSYDEPVVIATQKEADAAREKGRFLKLEKHMEALKLENVRDFGFATVQENTFGI